MRPIKNDLTGMRFGRLIVRGRVIVNNRTMWECDCDCGNHTVVDGSNLIYGTTRSCGCYRSERLREVHERHAIPPGTRYGRLTVMGADNEYAYAICDCGTVKCVSKKHLLDGTTRSCGCLRRDNMSALGHSRKGVKNTAHHNR